MDVDFCPGYAAEPFRTLCREYESARYPARAFRVEWGPIFHRGRLDGSARVLALGPDPAAQESLARRILVGAAGRRVQGFLSKLGITRRYALLNAFLFSVVSPSAGETERSRRSIVRYRERWLEAILAHSEVSAVVAFGGLADDAWRTFVEGSGAAYAALPYRAVRHPTWPESAARDGGDASALTRTMLAQWNDALRFLRPLVTPESHRAALFGEAFLPSDLPSIPAFDLPPGLPEWMRYSEGWAKRTGKTDLERRRTLHIVVPDGIVRGAED